MAPREVSSSMDFMAARPVFVELPRIRVDVSIPDTVDGVESLKEWIWATQKQTILSSMVVQDRQDRASCLLNQVSRCRLSSLDDLKVAYKCLLTGLLELLDSDFAFVGETIHGEDGSLHLEAHASMSSSSALRDDGLPTFCFQERGYDVGFHNRLSAFHQKVYTMEQAMIYNTTLAHASKNALSTPPARDDNFLCIPLYNSNEEGDDVIGMLLVSNKRRGYSVYEMDCLQEFQKTAGKLAECLCILEEKSDAQKQKETRVKELEQTNQKLQDSNRSLIRASTAQLKHFACMSHEIRTPLNCIIGMCSVLYESEMNTVQKESLEMVITSSNLLLTVVDDVLDFSKLATGNVAINIHRASLRRTLDAIVCSFETKARSCGLALRTFFSASVPEHFYTDSRRLQQILYNLLGNALKFSRDGGEIELHVKVVEGIPNEATAMKPREKFLQFVVKDYGRGIEKSQFQNIFKPFQQASADTERLYGGTGLGLTITSRLVEALGGKISVDSSLGEWSEFVVSLPLKGEQSTNISNSIDQSVRESSIFLVSGDKQATEQIVQVFKEWQIQCIPVPSMQGVKHFLDQNPERRQRRCICLVEETLFDDRSFNTLSRKTSTALLTFGPQYSVKATAAHFRSLVGVLPCVLMDALVSALQKRCHPNQGYHSSAPAPRDDQKLPSVVDIRKLRILVAEDNMINQKVLGRMLQNLGVQRVDFVDNGRKAVDQAAIQDYECILMDYQMPCMNGVEACRLILGKGQENEPNASKRQKRHLPKVVFVTAHASEIFELECRQAGAVGFLPKPFKLENIQKCLQNLVCTAVAETAS